MATWLIPVSVAHAVLLPAASDPGKARAAVLAVPAVWGLHELHVWGRPRQGPAPFVLGARPDDRDGLLRASVPALALRVDEGRW